MDLISSHFKLQVPFFVSPPKLLVPVFDSVGSYF